MKPGTLCYIAHCPAVPEWVGRVVDVVGPGKRPGRVRIDARWLPIDSVFIGYEIKPSFLRPIHGPAAEQSIRETDTVKDHDEITRRMA